MEGGNTLTPFQKSTGRYAESWSATPTFFTRRLSPQPSKDWDSNSTLPSDNKETWWGGAKKGKSAFHFLHPRQGLAGAGPFTFTQHQYDWKWSVHQGPSALYLPQPLVSGEPSWELYIYTFFPAWPNAVLWIHASLYPSSRPSPTKWAGPSGKVTWAPIPIGVGLKDVVWGRTGQYSTTLFTSLGSEPSGKLSLLLHLGICEAE